MKPGPFSVWRARRAYEQFTGHPATTSQRVQLDHKPVAGYQLGQVVGIAYEATRDGITDQYFHRFKKKARPGLVSRSDGKQLYLTGGDYRVTERGIEDMAAELFVVNPSRRSRKRRTGGHKKRSRSLFRRNPTEAAGGTSARSWRRNPIRRRGRHRRRVARSFRRNPIRIGGKGGLAIAPLILPGIMIGGGAVGVELVMGYLPLPPALKTGPARFVTKGVVAVGIGWALAKFVNKRAGESFALGGIAIAAHDALKSAMTGVLPGAKFGSAANWDKYAYDFPSIDSYPSPGLGYYSPGATYDVSNGDGMGEYMQPGNMGEYVSL